MSRAAQATPLLVTLTALINRAHSQDARDSFAALALEEQNWEALLEEADRHGVAGVLYFALRGGESNGVPAEILSKLENRFKRHHLDNWLRNEMSAQLVQAFTAAQIPVMVLKGAALAATVYEDIGLRPYMDIDLLVREQDAARAQDILSARGALHADTAEGFSEIFNGQTAYILDTHPRTRIDLHWQLFIYDYYARRIPDDWWWEHAIPLNLGAAPALTLAPLAQILYLTAHAALHHRNERLIWWYDIARLVEKYGATLDWDELVRTAERFGISTAVQTGLVRAVEWFHAPVPPLVPEALGGAKRDFKTQIVYRLATAPYWEARVLLGGASPTGARSKLAFWLHHLFPPRTYMYKRYGLKHDAQLVWYYPGRVGAVAFKFVRSLWSAARNQL